MSLRSTYTRIGMALAAGSLVALAGATPALADGEGGTGSSDNHQWSNSGDGGGREQGGGGDGGGQTSNSGGGDGGGGNGHTWNNGGGTGGHTWNNGGGGDGTGQTSNSGGGDGNGHTWNNGGGGNGHEQGNGNGRGDDAGQNSPRLYQGRITARGGLALRSSPTRGSQLIRVARQGEIVSIFCKTSGQAVEGNPLWYLLTDGTWAWGAARYIDNIGPAPRWC
ncbi:SH3 domain-containing protein [Streptomyces sp. NPDC002742]|uniref:SH3 domain-containing protein n=1 Tax=Streptomyces sp. NPDC002742 TaxID=3364663 RepID=UPI0036CF095F